MAGLLEDLPADWRVIPFGEVVSDSAFGPRFSGDLYAEDGNVATLRTTDMDDDGWISYETMPLAKLETAKFQNHLLRKDDLVITRSGTCGIAGIFRGFDKPVLPGAFLIRFRLNEQADVRFFRYLFNSKAGRGHLLSIAAGAVQQNINITNLKLPVPLPPLPVQRRIASILSAYDDLIENNTRRIAILEEMARALYREWFVHFRFPGREKIKMVDSPLGPIPKGWDVATLSGLADINASSIKRGEELHSINYVDIASVSTGRIEKVEQLDLQDAPGRARRIVRHGDIIWSTVRPNRRSYSVIIDPVPNLIVSTGFAVISATSAPFTYLYYVVTTDEFAAYLTNHATGSAYPAVNAKDFENAPVVLPPKELLSRFHDITEPNLRLRELLTRKATNLRTTRDLLLPKLISGEIDVLNTAGPPLEAIA